MSYNLCTSDEAIVSLATKPGSPDLTDGFEHFYGTWNKFKLLLHKNKPPEVDIRSLFLLQLESYNVGSDMANKLGLSVAELRNFDNLLLKFEDHCISRIVLKFERWKSLLATHRKHASNFLHHEDSGIKIRACISPETANRSTNSKFSIQDDENENPKQNQASRLLVYEECEKKNARSESVAVCDDSCHSQNDQSVMWISNGAGNIKFSNDMKRSVDVFIDVAGRENSNSSEMLSKEVTFQTIADAKVRSDSNLLTINGSNSDQNYSDSSEIKLANDISIPHRSNHKEDRKEVCCPMCECRCDTKRALKRHMKSHLEKHEQPKNKATSKQRDDLKCQKQALPYRKKAMSRQGYYNSNTADSITKTCTNLKRSRVKHSVSKCSQLVSYGMSAKSSLVYHNKKTRTKSHLKDKQFKCEVCQISFERQAKLKQHRLSHIGEKAFDCKICGTAFSDKSHLNVHLRVHSGEKPFKCDLCESSFSESTKLKNHKRIHTGEKPFICEVCGSSFSVLSSLRSHMKIHSGERPYKCGSCDFASAHLSNLKAHLLAHSGERKFACEVCGACFTETAKLKRHKMVHTGEKPYNCEVCGTRFADKSHLTVHLRIHSGEKPFKCMHCSSAFVESSKLKNHLRTHTGEKPYVCEVCGMSFAVSYSLKSHMRRHTGEKPYKCEICGYATSQSSNLKTHMIVHNGNKPHICSECGASFSEVSKLNRHKVIHTEPQKEETGRSDQLHQHGHQQSHSSLKQSCNGWQEMGDPRHSSILDKDHLVSHSSSSSHKQFQGSSHVVEKSNDNTFSSVGESQFRDMARGFRGCLPSALDQSSEISGPICPAAVLNQTDQNMVDPDPSHFSSIYREEGILDAVPHVVLGSL